MAIFYKGVGVGTHLHGIDLRTTGITPFNPGASHIIDAVMRHIVRGTVTSCYVSLTKSEGVAIDYAKNGSRLRPSASNPAYVYEISIGVPPPSNVRLLDPLCFIASQQQGPLVSPSYHHDGNQGFLQHVINPALSLLLPPTAPRLPGMGGGASAVNLSIELNAMVFALRDAEILVVGTVPQACVTYRYDIY
jgi:hypothetical protein